MDVYDGDTYKVLINGKLQVIRLANVDAPELNQYYGKLVKSRVSNLILGRIVDLEPIGKDRFRRTVANVTVGGKSLDSILVVSGWAWHYVAYSHHPYLSNVESQARRNCWGCGDVRKMFLHGSGESLINDKNGFMKCAAKHFDLSF